MLWGVIALAGTIMAPSVAPLDRSLHPPAEALTLAALCGSALFVALAGRAPPVAAIAALPRRRLLARSLVLTAKSAQEEVVWRGLLLGTLVVPLGRVGALALCTALFAAAHVPRQGHGAAVHLATGGVFGAVLLGTGRLSAAIASHASYNVLVGASALARATPSVSDTGVPDGMLVASSAAQHRPISMRTVCSPSPAPVPLAARLDGVVKSFGRVRALQGIDLRLERREVLALLGPNGAGKSTVVAILLGLRRPDAGRAWLAGRDPRDPRARASVGAVLQDVAFPPTLRVRETVDLVRAHFPCPCSADEALERLGLSSLGRREGAGLSGGQARRLAVALALVGNPDVLFLDEPTAGTDAAARRSLLRDLASFAARGGSVLLTTQQLSEAEEIATRVVVLGEGRVVAEGSVTELRARAGKTRITLRAPRLPPLVGVTSAESSLDRHVVYVEDADAFVGDMVRSGVEFSELEVMRPSLEDAFLSLVLEDFP